MDLSAISGVIQTIGGLLAQEVTLLLGVKEQVEALERELKWMQSFLKVADARKADNEVVRTCVADIRGLAYDAEDLIETFALKRSASILKKGRLLHQTKEELGKITGKIRDLARQLQTYDVSKLGVGEGSSSSTERQEPKQRYPHIVDDNIVGMGDDIKKLVAVLVDDRSDCRVVTICGMGGLGKTTLAKKIYQHHQIIGHFEHLAWAYVSQQCLKKKVWEDILSSLSPTYQRDNKQSDEELTKKLFNFMKDNKCLVILDDIWSFRAWASLNPAFPSGGTSSKVLLTSRNKEVIHEGTGGYVYELRALNDEESWELFQKIAFPMRDSTDYRLDGRVGELGKNMAERCGGLPLAIIVLGAILATKNSLNEWQIVYENFKSYLKKGKEPQGVEEVLSLSYDDLPPDLRPCFLYLSLFPEDDEISTSKLIQLWAAEGIVSSEQGEGNGGEIIEDVAEAYLNELVGRCMIEVRKRDAASSKIKTVQMHDLMRGLCLSKANQENFLFMVDQSNAHSPSPVRKVRRVSAHVFFWIKRIKSPNIRSLLLFSEFLSMEEFLKVQPQTVVNYISKHECCNPLACIFYAFIACKLWGTMGGIWTYICNKFKLLRVLDFEVNGDVAGCKAPSDIGNLIHLRFLSLNGLEFVRSKLPSSLGNLRCLQTLDLRIKAQCSGSIHVPNVIWRMKQLRHLYLPKKCKSKDKLKLDTLKNLQTLVNFNTKYCHLEDLSKLENLRVLKIRWHFNIEDLKEDFDKSPIVRSKFLHSLFISWYTKGIDPRHLARLLSSCVCICKLSLKVDIGKLPEHHCFSVDIAYIHLSYSKLEEDPMPTLEKLRNLRILQFGGSAFTGEKMICSTGGFPRLDSLSLESLSNLEELQVDEGAMPVLRRLEIVNCRKMKKLSDGLSFITTLQELAIKRMPKAFKDKLVEGGEDFNKFQHVPSITFQDCD